MKIYSEGDWTDEELKQLLELSLKLDKTFAIEWGLCDADEQLEEYLKPDNTCRSCDGVGGDGPYVCVACGGKGTV